MLRVKNLKWRVAKQLPSVADQLTSFPLDERIAARLALDQCVRQPQFGKHEISTKKIKIANDNRRVYFGRTVMGLYTVSWVVHHFLEVPVIIDVSTQMHSNINARRFFETGRFPRMMPFVIS